MALLLIFPLGLGWLLARRVLRESEPVACVALALALGIALTLLGVNGFYRLYSAHYGFGGLVPAVRATLALELLGILGLWRNRTAPKLKSWRIHPVVLLACCVIYWFVASQQIINPDDDYWIHTALQGLMRHGNFPPFNPFFSAIPMNGHYGRNLSIVTAAYLGGMDIFMSQHVMTCLVQLTTYLLLYFGMRRATGSEFQALLGSGLMEFGVNCGGRGGLMDLVQNNNAYVHLYLSLYFFLIMVTARSARLGPAWLGGMVLGGYAIVYETHFGLSTLATIAVFPLAWKLSPRRKQLTLAWLAVGLMALPIAATQGGPITNLLERRLSHQNLQTTQLSKGMQNQSQVIKLTFPKKNLFQIYLETGEYQRISMVYYSNTFLHWFYTKSSGHGYAYIWSLSVIKLHFLALYLAPLSIGYALRKRNLPAVWLASFGCIAYLIPGLVDFGPVYEAEYYRWECAASLCFAGVLGLAMGEWLEPRLFVMGYHDCPESLASAFGWGRERVTSLVRYLFAPSVRSLPAPRLDRRGWLWVLLACFLWTDTVGCGQFLVTRWGQLRQWGGSGLVFPSTADWMASHSVLDFQPIDWRAARWLEGQVKPGDRLLTNFRQENNFSIEFESTLTGVTGARCVGHALPLDDEAIGTTPYHRAAPAAVFWATHDAHQLDVMGVDFVYVRPGAESQSLSNVPGLTLVHLEHQDQQRREIYHYQHPAPVSRPTGPIPTVDSIQLGAPFLRGGRVYTAQVRLHNPSAQPLSLDDCDLVPIPHALKDDLEPSEVELTHTRLHGSIPAGASSVVPMPWMAPYTEGDYRLRLEWRAGGQRAELALPKADFKVNFQSTLAQFKTVRGDVSSEGVLTGAGFKNELVDCRYALTGPTTELLRSQPDRRVLVGVAARHVAAGPFKGGVGEICGAPLLSGQPATEAKFSVHVGEALGDYFLLPGVNLETVEIQKPLQLDVHAQLPDSPGFYQLDLFVSPRQGRLIRYPGPIVEVKP